MVTYTYLFTLVFCKIERVYLYHSLVNRTYIELPLHQIPVLTSTTKFYQIYEPIRTSKRGTTSQINIRANNIAQNELKF